MPELAELLMTENWRRLLNHDLGSMTAVLVGELGHRSVVLYDPQLLPALETATFMLVDATFGSVPQIPFAVPRLDRFVQLLLIVFIKYDCVSIYWYKKSVMII